MKARLLLPPLTTGRFLPPPLSPFLSDAGLLNSGSFRSFRAATRKKNQEKVLPSPTATIDTQTRASLGGGRPHEPPQ